MLRRLIEVSLATLVGVAVVCAAANAKDHEDVNRTVRQGTVYNQLAPDSRTQLSPERVIIIDGETYTELVPPLPSKDPFGRPINTTAQRALAATAGVPISSVQMKGISSAVNSVTNPWGRWNYTLSNGQIDNECDKLSNKIVLVDGTTTAYYTLHYFRTARTDWISTGWIYHSSASSNEYVWNSTFKQGEVVDSYGYTWKGGVSTGAWGPTVTVAQATKNAPSWAIKGFIWVSKKIIDILIGKSSLEIPFDEIASWGFDWLLDTLVDSSVNFKIVDENGNPLQGLAATADKHNVITYTYSYLGGINITRTSRNQTGRRCPAVWPLRTPLRKAGS
ncbi:MAG: hypothetical protein HYX75_04680 [Acidobacteria bacterium]|nr:hypothetical protein [Acidobacteriota bacterium]